MQIKKRIKFRIIEFYFKVQEIINKTSYELNIQILFNNHLGSSSLPSTFISIINPSVKLLHFVTKYGN